MPVYYTWRSALVPAPAELPVVAVAGLIGEVVEGVVVVVAAVPPAVGRVRVAGGTGPGVCSRGTLCTL